MKRRSGEDEEGEKLEKEKIILNKTKNLKRNLY